MSSFGLFLLCVQACLIQNAYSQCIGAITPGIGGSYGWGAGLAGPGLAGAGYGLGGAYGWGAAGLAGPAGIAAGYGPAYGGSGIGNVAVAGELPVGGATALAGQVPIIGAVEYAGPVCAAGTVSIAGNCAGGCGCGGLGGAYGIY